MKYKFGWILGLSILIACQSDPKSTVPSDNADTEDEEMVDELVDTLLNTENIRTFESLGFTTVAKSKVQGFDWSKFVMSDTWKEDTMYTTPFRPDADYYTNYGRFLKYSPDSTYFIDLDSYNINIHKDSKGNWIGEELGPDTEVSLVNPKTGEKTRLIFFGPSSSVEEAIWLDDDNVALLGVHDDGVSGAIAVVWKYHLPTQTFYLYELKDGLSAQELIGSWRHERLKGVTIR